jgi:hypothetical protein
MEQRLARAGKPSCIDGLDRIKDCEGRSLLIVYDRPGWQFWLNARDDVEALLGYVKRLKKERDRLKRRLAHGNR